MKTVNFDMHDPYVTLGDIVAILPKSVSNTEWVVEPYLEPDGVGYFEVASEGQDPMTIAQESGRRFTHQDFVTAAKETPQVIWGTFRGYDRKRGSEPWLIINVVDSSAFDIASDDAEIHQLIRLKCGDVREGKW